MKQGGTTSEIVPDRVILSGQGHFLLYGNCFLYDENSGGCAQLLFEKAKGGDYETDL
jgi:hypothetical protein